MCCGFAHYISYHLLPSGSTVTCEPSCLSWDHIQTTVQQGFPQQYIIGAWVYGCVVGVGVGVGVGATST